MSTIQTSIPYRYLSAFLAFLLLGGWAFYINDHGDSHTEIIPGIILGSCSFIITLIMTHFISFQFNKFSSGILRIVLPPVITVNITGSMLILWQGHIQFCLPPLIVALLFNFYTVYKLYLKSQLQREVNDTN